MSKPENPTVTRFAAARPLLCSLAMMALLVSSASSSSNATQEKKKPLRDKQTQPESTPQPQRADEPLRLHSDLVVVNVTVTDASGEYAHGLNAADFNISEDDAVQGVSSFAAEETPFAAAILIDMSGSMGYKFGLVRAAAASFIDHIRENDQVAVYGFNNKVRLLQEFSDSRDISDYVWDAKAEDSTRLYDCIDEAIEALVKRPEKRRAVVMISDGWDSSSRKATSASVMKKALSVGVTIYALDLIEASALNGSGSEVMPLRRGRGEMKEFAGQTGGRYVNSPQGDGLDDEFNGIVEELRNQYTLTYYSTNQKRDGRWRKLNVNVSRQGMTTRARRGYWAPKSG
ncbi:MAG TPA: VWA domain-containing protein [Blastocatellia bacterium]|nr:VWA domain-containing protein [Blastocatellia bacterium]